jgi:CRISPR-associated endonuclease Cas1
MNALWISRICAYTHSPLARKSARVIIAFKCKRQGILLQKYKKRILQPHFIHYATLPNMLLEEARIAKQFWRQFANLIPETNFHSRKTRGRDTVNTLLNIGYHYVTNKVKKILARHQISPAIGLLHTAQSANGAPLAYDCVELFRSDIVDQEVIRFFRLKKKKVNILRERDIAYFIQNLKKRIDKKFYIKEFKSCVRYRYYMELQILKLVYAVNHKTVFKPIHLPTRHDIRCSNLT